MIIFCVIWIPIVAIIKIVKAEGNLCQVRPQKSCHILKSLFPWHSQEHLYILLKNMFGILRCSLIGFVDQNTSLVVESDENLSCCLLMRRQSLILWKCIQK